LVQVTVDAIIGGVQHAILEPFDRDIARRVGPVADLAEGLDPVDPLAMLGPESVGVANRALVHLAIFGLIDEGSFGPFCRHVIDFVGHYGPSTLKPMNAASIGRFIVEGDYASAELPPTSTTV